MLDAPELADPAEAAQYRAIARAIDHLVIRYQDQPSLEELAEAAGLSPFHFQRVFKRWAGISPKRFAQYLTLEHAKDLLAERVSLLEAALEVGLSGPSRLHDLFIACEAMTPGEYKERGTSLVIRWGFHDSPFGRALLGVTDRGLCWLSFVTQDEAAAFAEFRREWALATLVEDVSATMPFARRAFFPAGDDEAPMRLLLRGTNFQIKVWEALLRIPAGRLVSYQTVASAIGQPAAVRAVGHAVGRNQISLVIPCHRVILKSGAIRDYRWGRARKRVMLAWEAAQRGRGEPAGGWP
ncbi:MAG TPA: methylated-DNA--[protein]-cysteine S-methyltransferase [Azospirillaceae bacterium]|nr:methylated-DNA--[protein]-cysteine S-methyltransferase [Azospirillaceae bacterium]